MMEIWSGASVNFRGRDLKVGEAKLDGEPARLLFGEAIGINTGKRTNERASFRDRYDRLCRRYSMTKGPPKRVQKRLKDK